MLIAKAGLPSIAVTIGTLTLFRGVAEILLGSQTIPGIGDRPSRPGSPRSASSRSPGTELSCTTVIFIVLAVVFGVVLHATPLGRSLYAIGLQPEAARFAGHAGDAGQALAVRLLRPHVRLRRDPAAPAQNSSVSYNAGDGLELNVVAIVLLGGVSIFGGRGTMARGRAGGRDRRRPSRWR